MLARRRSRPRRLRRQLVRQLRPFVLDHGAHLVRDALDRLDVEQVLVEPLHVRRRQDYAVDDAGHVDAALFPAGHLIRSPPAWARPATDQISDALIGDADPSGSEPIESVEGRGARDMILLAAKYRNGGIEMF